MPTDSAGPALTIRSGLGPADAGRISRMVRATGFFSEEEQGIARELADETLQRGAASGYEFLFVELDGETCGYSCYGRIPGTRASWDLYWIVVDPRHQGMGMGRILIEATETAVREAGGHSLWIETSSREQYLPTRAFYARCGYALAAEFADFYAPGDAKCIFCRYFTGQAQPA